MWRSHGLFRSGTREQHTAPEKERQSIRARTCEPMTDTKRIFEQEITALFATHISSRSAFVNQVRGVVGFESLHRAEPSQISPAAQAAGIRGSS
jgi:hypothetical protein